MVPSPRNLTPPFSGYPRTCQTRDRRGRTAYVVDVRYLHPVAARCADELGKLFAGAIVIGALFALASRDVTAWWIWAAALILPLSLKGLWQFLFRRALRFRTTVTLSGDAVRIRGRTYDRHQVTGFILLEDFDRMHAERRTAHHLNMLAQRSKAKPLAPRPLYHDERTRQVVCAIAGGFVGICTAFGQKEFLAIRMRLNGINDALNAELGAGMGRPLDPTADTPAGRGGIPE